MKINLSTIFSFNLWGPIANNLNYKGLFQNKGLDMLLANQNSHLLPILNYEQNSIEDRSILFSEALGNLIKKENIEKFNLVSFCLNGLEARLALNENVHFKNKLNKFLTIGTPHHGCVLSNAIKKNLISATHLEKINFISGTHSNSLRELNHQYMSDFNNYLEDSKEDNYFSLNGDKIYEELNPLFKNVFSILLDLKLSKDHFFGDGLFFDEETKYFNHIGQVNADFYELSPFGLTHNTCQRIQNFI